jgi:aldehyde:ferredoxin oxidoreductase
VQEGALVDRWYGYAGKALYVDLTSEAFTVRPLSGELVDAYVGGRGFSSRLLWEMAGPGVDPFSPANPLIIATGPFAGIVPSGGRFVVAAKSPLTGLIGFANAGGHFGAALKYAGLDFIVVTGKASRPVYLDIRDVQARLADAGDLWGEDTRKTDSALRAQAGEMAHVLAIGPAGENLVRFASIMADQDHAAARTGMGAVMGSKKLKAIVVAGTGGLIVADPVAYGEAEDELLDSFRRDRVSSEVAPAYGTTMLLSPTAAKGGLGTRNFQTGYFAEADKISGETLRRTWLVKGRACSLCPLACDRFSHVTSGEFKGTWVGGPEYATQQNQGSRIGNSNLAALLKANELCNRLGLDTYSAGGVIGFAFECYQRGLIGLPDTGGRALEWGNYREQLALIGDIAFRRGFGNVLADGILAAADRIGPASEEFAMHIKGLDYPSKDARAYNDYGLCCSISVRGADHLYALSNVRNISPEESLLFFGTDKAAQQHLPDGKGKVVKWYEDGMTMCDLTGACKLAVHTYASSASVIEARRRMLPRLYSAVTGRAKSYEEFKIVAERVASLEKAYNIREKDTGRAEDGVPRRFLFEPMPDGPAAGRLYDQEPMLDEYYTAKGWDPRSGKPTRSALERVGLSQVALELERLGRLPAEQTAAIGE